MYGRPEFLTSRVSGDLPPKAALSQFGALALPDCAPLETPEAHRELRADLRGLMLHAGTELLICSLRAGSDLLAAQTALSLGIGVLAVITPDLPGFSRRWFEGASLRPDQEASLGAAAMLACLEHPQVQIETVEGPPLERPPLPESQAGGKRTSGKQTSGEQAARKAESQILRREILKRLSCCKGVAHVCAGFNEQPEAVTARSGQVYCVRIELRQTRQQKPTAIRG